MEEDGCRETVIREIVEDKESEGDADYNPQADFNGDGCVTIHDFSLLATNFGQDHRPEEGAAEADASSLSQRCPRAGVRPSFIIDQPIIQAITGQSYRVAVSLAAETPVDGAAAYIDFDASLLKVKRIIAGDTFLLGLQNECQTQRAMIAWAPPPYPPPRGSGVRGEGRGRGVRGEGRGRRVRRERRLRSDDHRIRGSRRW
jgi:hypothetical protein